MCLMREISLDGMAAEKKADLLERHYGKRWIVLYAKTRTYSGKYIGMDEGFAILKPFKGGNYRKGAFRDSIENETSLVRIIDIEAFEPTTRENVEGYCRMINKRRRAEENKESEINSEQNS